MKTALSIDIRLLGYYTQPYRLRGGLPMTPDPLIPPHGAYRELKSCQMAEIIFEGRERPWKKP
jgi:hypothetical protein